MSSLWPANERGNGENVLNGIALGKDHVLLTGKRWDRMYKVHFPDWPSLFVNNNQSGDVDEDRNVGEEEEDEVVTEVVLPDSETDPTEKNENNASKSEDQIQNTSIENNNKNGDADEVGNDGEGEKDEVDTEVVLPGSETDPTEENEENAPEAMDQIQSTIINTFTILEQVDHDPSSFTQGLSYSNDGKVIFETTGIYRNSKVRRINPDTFDVELSVDMDDKFFGEGSTIYTDADGNERLMEITWNEQTGFIYDTGTLEKLQEFKYTTGGGDQGWGITYNPSEQEFIVSDGSKFLYFWDRDTLAEKRTVAVTRFDGSSQNQLNELEFMDGLVCCNIWHSDDIICVNPVTGKSVREYDMSSLWPADQRGGRENVLNGIALGKDHVLLTGKLWDRMYKVVFPDWTTLF